MAALRGGAWKNATFASSTDPLIWVTRATYRSTCFPARAAVGFGAGGEGSAPPQLATTRAARATATSQRWCVVRRIAGPFTCQSVRAAGAGETTLRAPD